MCEFTNGKRSEAYKGGWREWGCDPQAEGEGA